MAVTKVKRKTWTFQEYMALPEDGYRYEIIDGELQVTPSPLLEHQNPVTAFAIHLGTNVLDHDWGKVLVAPFTVRLGEDQVYEPDIIAVRKSRMHLLTRSHLDGAPDLVVEVLSDSTAALDRGKKMAAYEAGGVAEYWIVGPKNRTVEVYELGEKGYRLARTFQGDEELQSALFPGLSIPLARIW